ncbi:MAG: helix-turn-helix domain-containing protein [Planctomycetota bacterium]|jgi:AraC-like DNA-binding protein
MPQWPKEIPESNIRSPETQTFWVLEDQLRQAYRHHTGILFTGVEKSPMPFQTERTANSYHSLVMLFSGEFSVYGTPVPLRPGRGQTVILPAGIPRQLVLKKGPLHLAFVWLEPNGEWDSFAEGGIRIVPSHCAEAYAHVLLALRDESEPTPTAQALASTLLTYLRRIRTAFCGPRPDHHHQQLTILQDRIRTSPGQPWSVERLAEAMHISTGHLRRISQQYAGIPPSELIARMRMEHAQERLRRENDTLEGLARSIGFTNAYTFSRAFLKFTGERPGAYRRRVRETDA